MRWCTLCGTLIVLPRLIVSAGWQLGMEAKTLQRQSQLEDLLKKVPVSLGGGKMQVSLYDVLPSAGVRDLQRIIEDFARNG